MKHDVKTTTSSSKQQFLLVTTRLRPLPQPSFFVVYNMVSTEVLAVFENTSDQLLELFENFCDLFRNATLHSQAVQFPCSASSNNYARQVQRRYERGRPGGGGPVIELKYRLSALGTELFFSSAS